MNLLQTYNHCLMIRKDQQFQLVQIVKDETLLDIYSLEEETQKNVLRLLDRTTSDSNSLSTEQNIFWLYINPQSKTAMVWNSFFMIIFYLFQLQISLSLAFGPDFINTQLSLSSEYYPVYVTILCLLILDMILSFFKGYYAFGKGKVIDNPKKIALNNLKTQFPFDIIVIIMYTIPLIYKDHLTNFLQLIPAGLIWIKKFRIQNQIQTYLQYYAKFRAAFMILILFIDVLMIGNYGACMFIGMDLVLFRYGVFGSSDTSPYYWLIDNTMYGANLIDGPWYFQYVYGQSFATGTLSTLAPGPFARNPIQIVFAIIVMIFFMILASYVAQVLIQIIYTYTERRIFHEDNIISFDNFMQLKDVQKRVRKRIYNFFQLIWEIQLKMETKEQEQMMNKLPSYLKEQLLMQIGFTKYLYFLDCLSNDKIISKKISLKIQRSAIDSNTIIFSSQKPTNHTQKSIIFIKQGMAKYYLIQTNKQEINQQNSALQYNRIEKLLSLSNIQKVLGVYQFITAQNYSVTCKSIDLCLIQTLSWKDFWEIINQLNLQEQFHELKHRVLFDRALSLINKVCIICLQNHLESECPQIYPKILIQSSLIKQNFLFQNPRKKKNRKKLISKKWYEKDGNISPNLMNPITFLNLGQLLFNKLQNFLFTDQSIEEITYYQNYYQNYNIHLIQ